MPTSRNQDVWAELEAYAATIRGTTIRDLFEREPQRVLSSRVGPILLDYSRTHLTSRGLGLLRELVEQAGLVQAVEAMFQGEELNFTESRSVLHVALRDPDGPRLMVRGQDVRTMVSRELERMGEIAGALREGRWLGHTGARIRHVIHIGIGGSYLGPAMAVQALGPYARARGLSPELTIRFVSNVDPSSLAEALEGLDPAETLFIVVSKSFTTQETMTNARVAVRWLVEGLGSEDAVSRHVVAVSANRAGAAGFGVDVDRCFLSMWDWVGGRYSLPSAVGLPVMLLVGEEGFRELLRGYRLMDEHLREDPVRSMPATLALLDLWYSNVMGLKTRAVVPYYHGLRRFPAFIQQLVMESNGKRITRDGEVVSRETSPVFWGEPGTDAQHSFFQLLHQGTQVVPVDLIGVAKAFDGPADGHAKLFANMVAQAEALAFGRSEAEVRAMGVPEILVPHKVFPGDRPSVLILLDRVDPKALGALVALYEHRVFVQGVVWGINSFDQWGVELGKELAKGILARLGGGPELPARLRLALDFFDDPGSVEA